MKLEIRDPEVGDMAILTKKVADIPEGSGVLIKADLGEGFAVYWRDMDDEVTTRVINKNLLLRTRKAPTEKVKIKIKPERWRSVMILKSYQNLLESYRSGKIMPHIQLNSNSQPINDMMAIAAINAKVPIVCSYV